MLNSEWVCPGACDRLSIYRSVSEPLKLTPEAWLLFLGTGRVVEQEVQTPRSCQWGLMINSKATTGAKSSTLPWWWLAQRADCQVINPMNFNIHVANSKQFQRPNLQCPTLPFLRGYRPWSLKRSLKSIHSQNKHTLIDKIQGSTWISVIKGFIKQNVFHHI